MSRRTRAVILALAVAAALMPVTLATDADAPAMQAFSKTVRDGTLVEFTKEDFNSRVTIDKELEGIVITTLPDASEGVLKFGMRSLMVGEAIPAEGLDMLRFIAEGPGEIRTSFEFLPVFAGGASLDSVAVHINLTGRENRPPVAENQALSTYKNIALTAHFKATDPDADPLSYRITVKPKRGEITLAGDGSFVYTPYQNKTGKDSFKYVAIDCCGNSSEEAEVIVKIDKPSTKLTYADMDGHRAHYTAIRLMESGVFTGEKLGGTYYFDPNRAVTRGEFITMALGAVGIADLAPVTRTGFSDDADIPAWMKPGASAALKAGIISGVAVHDGRKLLDADSIITKAEAAVILNNAARLADAEVEPIFADFEAIPAWAYQAAVNLESAGVLQADGQGALGLDAQVTRADAAEMICAALDAGTQNKSKSGLLSWAFD